MQQLQQTLLDKAITYHRDGQLESAMLSYQEALIADSGDFNVPHLLGILYLQKQNFLLAQEMFHRAISLYSNYAQSHFYLSISFQELGDIDSAIIHLQRAIEIDPVYYEANLTLGNIHFNRHSYELSKLHFERCIKIDPTNTSAYCQLGLTLYFQDRQNLQLAINVFDKAIELNSQFAEAHLNKSLILLTEGCYEEAWPHYEWRTRTGRNLSRNGHLQLQSERWTGDQSLSGKTLLLYAEQGLGDSIQFSRYILKLADLNATVFLAVPQPLFNLFSEQNWSITIVPMEAAPLTDFHCPLPSLPLAFKTKLETIPHPGFLKYNRDKSAAFRGFNEAQSGLNIGVFWSSASTYTENHLRNIPLETFSNLFDLEGVKWTCLQKVILDKDLEFIRGKIHNLNLPYLGLADLSDTAALISNLDLVITVDTSIAHLSCALGIPTWILITNIPDWRWMRNREDSPWYPVARLYRQKEQGATTL
jgi:tetratricopeptide (TPR) repeat protein